MNATTTWTCKNCGASGDESETLERKEPLGMRSLYCPNCGSSEVETHPARGTCRFCGLVVTDGREESGYTGEGPDWMVDGDFGCDQSPETDEEGCGSHAVTDKEVRRAESSDTAAEVATRAEEKVQASARLRRQAPYMAKALRELLAEHGDRNETCGTMWARHALELAGALIDPDADPIDTAAEAGAAEVAG